MNDDLVAKLERERFGGMPRWHLESAATARQLRPAEDPVIRRLEEEAAWWTDGTRAPAGRDSIERRLTVIRGAA